MENYLLIAIFALVWSGGWIFTTPRLKGALGERRVNKTLKRFLDEDKYKLLKDLTLPTHDGTTQVDHVVISRFGVFVIETKNMQGWIFGGKDQKQWTQQIYRYKSRFQNPIRQNYKHVKTVQKLLGLESTQIHGIVVFVGNAEPKTFMPSEVVWGAKSLAKYIDSKRNVMFLDYQVTDLASRLSQKSLKPGFWTRRAHIKNVKTTAAKRKKEAFQCPRCNAEMVLRTNKKSGDRFLGCSRFPKCKGTRKLS